MSDTMMEFRGGAAYLAKRCQAPVVPVYLEGVRAIMPKGQSGVHRARITVHFGAPMYPRSALVTGRKEEDARRFTVRIQEAVVGLGATPPTT
jgi:1-acyl-sn-glycerol-3-phosphate acyltransferase